MTKRTLAVTAATDLRRQHLRRRRPCPGRLRGANACKGQSACKTRTSACKGQNACKGQGFVMTGTAIECTAIKRK